MSSESPCCSQTMCSTAEVNWQKKKPPQSREKRDRSPSDHRAYTRNAAPVCMSACMGKDVHADTHRHYLFLMHVLQNQRDSQGFAARKGKPGRRIAYSNFNSRRAERLEVVLRLFPKAKHNKKAFCGFGRYKSVIYYFTRLNLELLAAPSERSK